MLADQLELAHLARLTHRVLHGALERSAIGEWAQIPGRLRHPLRAFVDGAEARDERNAIHRVDRGDRQLLAHADVCPAGCVAIQCRAMSMRRQIQTWSCRCTWSMNRSSAALRPGRPASRQCRPTDIIFGARSPSRYRTS